MSVWKRIDSSHNLPHIMTNDVCIYAREYKAGQGYAAGETNQLILNFKMFVTFKGTNRWRYRDRDVRKFAEEAALNFGANSTVAITAIPSSKAKNDPDYTNRFEDMLTHLLTLRPNLIEEWPVELIQTVQASHQAGSRNPQQIQQHYRWRGFQNGVPQTLVLFDDVVTTGSHFRAMSDFIRSNGYTGNIVGIFWARSVFPTAQVVFSAVEDE
ncbi:MAG: hypothetical protein J0M15_15555 [Deltaproteobacteria bacterium]|jgi:hypothetical protein|nr:hypothetical protein [Deltaproteobacteria bacterium]